MSLLNQKNTKSKKKGDKKEVAASAKSSKFIAKSKTAFVSKQLNTGSQRGS